MLLDPPFTFGFGMGVSGAALATAASNTVSAGFFLLEYRKLGARSLRIACLSVPLTALNGLISYTLQAMGKGTQSAILTACRQGLVDPAAFPDGPCFRDVRHDLDPDGHGAFDDAGVAGDISCDLPALEVRFILKTCIQ